MDSLLYSARCCCTWPVLILARLIGMGDWRARTELLKISLSMRAGRQQVLCWTRIVGHWDCDRDQHRLLWRVLTGDWYAKLPRGRWPRSLLPAGKTASVPATDPVSKRSPSRSSPAEQKGQLRALVLFAEKQSRFGVVSAQSAPKVFQDASLDANP